MSPNKNLGKYVIIQHQDYGCESGCTGHQFRLFDKRDNQVDSFYEFGCYETKEEAKEEVVAYWGERVEIKWDESEIWDCDDQPINLTQEKP